MKDNIDLIKPHEFEQNNHFYPKALNSELHPLVSYFLNLNRERLIERYCHLNPKVDPAALNSILEKPMKHFYWGGADLFYVTTKLGNRKMIVLETNSCPSGQKSMPAKTDADEHRGYGSLIEASFLPTMKKKRLPEGVLAVIYDKNHMEASGYAATLADLTNESVYLVPCFDKETELLNFENGILHIKLENGEQKPVRAALRYVTQRPWNRIPVITKTFIYNAPLICLAGGRNKLLASKAYELYNSEIRDSGLMIHVPNTIRDVTKLEIPLWVERFGGYAVIKDPYSNAGQGVYTITSQKELDAFLKEEHTYNQFIVQSLVGDYHWSSQHDAGTFYHIGTVPNKKREIYAADLRMMVYSSPNGFYPCATYARRARIPLAKHIDSQVNSWDMLGTNLSIKKGPNQWESDTSRLLMMDRKDFNTLGLGMDDLIEGYIQTVLTVTAIDQMAVNLVNSKGQFRSKLFQSLDSDSVLANEIMLS